MTRVRRSAELALAVVLSVAAASAVSAQTLRIVKPQHLSTVIGPTTIEIEVAAPTGVSIERVELLLDGAPLATLVAPPWRADFDAGDGSRGHRIEAALHLGDGRLIRDLIRTSALRIDEEIDVDLVNVYPLVLDGSGAYVTGLSRDDFRVFEDGEPQTLQRFTAEQRPLRVAIVLDTSLSMIRGDRIGDAKKAALGFLDMLQPQDDALVVTFSDEVKLAQDVTRERTLLAAAIERAEAKGGTALYDAIWRSARRLEEFDGRRVMVLLSDGRDEAANGFEPGSLHTLDEARLQAVRSEVMIFAIGLGKNLEREYAREWTRSAGASEAGVSLKAILEGLAVHTGGRLLISPSPGKLVRAFGDVEQALRHQYSLAYAPSNEAKDGKYRRIEVTVPTRPDVQVVVRQGYFAAGS